MLSTRNTLGLRYVLWQLRPLKGYVPFWFTFCMIDIVCDKVQHGGEKERKFSGLWWTGHWATYSHISWKEAIQFNRNKHLFSGDSFEEWIPDGKGSCSKLSVKHLLFIDITMGSHSCLSFSVMEAAYSSVLSCVLFSGQKEI